MLNRLRERIENAQQCLDGARGWIAEFPGDRADMTDERHGNDSRRVVRQHDGWVECSIPVGGETSFSVFLPACDVEGTATSDEAEGEATLPPTILVADNEPSILKMCRLVLETNGYRVHTAEKGQEAVAMYRSESGKIAVVVLDVNMPEISGLDVLAEMAATDPGVRVLFMSGAPLEPIPPAYHRNLCGFLEKPFRAIDLLDAIRQAQAKS